MKTGNVSPDVMTFVKTKQAREEKAAAKREPDKAIEEKVDLSTKRTSSPSIPVASYEEVLELLYGVDYDKLRDVNWISKEGTSKLTELLQP